MTYVKPMLKKERVEFIHRAFQRKDELEKFTSCGCEATYINVNRLAFESKGVTCPTCKENEVGHEILRDPSEISKANRLVQPAFAQVWINKTTVCRLCQNQMKSATLTNLCSGANDKGGCFAFFNTNFSCFKQVMTQLNRPFEDIVALFKKNGYEPSN